MNIKLNSNKAVQDISAIKRKLKKLLSGKWGDSFYREYMKVVEKRVWQLNEGSLGQDIGIPPTKVYETYELWDTFKYDEHGVDLPDHGFYIESLPDGFDVFNSTPAQIWAAVMATPAPLKFGPIWDISDMEAEFVEENLERLFDSL